MSTKKTDLDAKKLLALLREEGLAPRELGERIGASAEAVDEARVLVEDIATAEADAILALPPALARAALLAAGSAGRADVVVEAFSALDKEVQKEARRIAHHLRLRGVEVEAPTRPAPPPPPVEATPAAELPVLLSALDGRGEKVVFWSRSLPGRGVEVAQLVLSDVRGVVSMSLAELSRRRFRELCEELTRHGPVTVAEVPREVARAAIDRARVLGRERGELPSSFTGWAPQVLGPAPAAMPPPPAPHAEGRPPDDPAERVRLARDSALLFEHAEVDRWLPDEEALQRCALRVEEAQASPLYLSGPAGEQQREEAVAAAILRAAEAFFDVAARERWAGRLVETAYLLERTGRPEAARIAVAAADRLAAGAPLAEVPFGVTLFDRVFRAEPTAASATPEAEPPPSPESLLILPGSER